MKAKKRTLRNKHGIRIAVICASCKHCPLGKVIDPECEFRMCEYDKKNKKAVKPTDTCVNWEAKEQYVVIGNNDPGLIKRKDYIQLVSRIRIAENENKIPKDEELKTDDIRSMFLKDNDTIYYNW